jgi:hypothetical protein
MSWQHFVQLDYIRRLSLNEQLKRYNYYLMEQQAMQVTVNNTAAAGSGGTNTLSNPIPTSTAQILMNIVMDDELPVFSLNFFYPESMESLIEISENPIIANFSNGLTVNYDTVIEDLQNPTIGSSTDTLGTSRYFIQPETTGLPEGASLSANISISPSTNLAGIGTVYPGSGAYRIQSIVFENVNIELLTLDGHPLNTIDVSSLSALKVLSLTSSSLSTIDVSQLVNLQAIDVGQTALTLLDISTNTNLTKLVAFQCYTLSTITHDTLSNVNYVSLDDCNLSETSILNILLALDTNGLSNGYADFSNYSSGTNAVITNQTALDAVTSLTGKGWEVYVNT